MNINVNKIKKVHSTDSDSTEGYIRICIRSVTSLLIDVIVPLLSSLDPTFPIPQNTLNLAHIPYSLSYNHPHVDRDIYLLHIIIHTQNTHFANTHHSANPIMHRTYSMRQSRAPTASQIQNPPPPSSTTKSGRFFGKAGLGEFSVFFLLDFVREPTGTMAWLFSTLESNRQHPALWHVVRIFT